VLTGGGTLGCPVARTIALNVVGGNGHAGAEPAFVRLL
jgi:hypothetical protein